MKNIYFLLLLIAMSSIVFSSCSDDNEDILYTVSLVSNGGTNMVPLKVRSGERIPLNKLYPNPITNDGGTFDGWYADAALENEFDFNTPVTSDLTLYAKWFYKKYTVSFIMNGAPDIPDQEVIEGRTMELDKPKYDGHIFVAWYMDNEFGKIFSFNTPVTSDLTLYARWETPSPESWFAVDGNGVLTSCAPPDGTVTVVIPEGVKAIPAWFILANGLNEPGKPGFDTGKNIKEFILPESLESIGEGAFKFAGITSIIIPPLVRELESVSFQGCDQLKNFTFAPGSTLERIKSTPGNDPVISTAILETISFPPSLEYVGKYTLSGCNALKSVTFERSESPVIFYDYLPGGGVWLFGGYFPAKIAVPNDVRVAFLAGMRNVMQDYEYEKMSEITEGY